MNHRERGMALVLALLVIVLLESLAAVAASATLARIRLGGDEHLAIEAQLAAASALAQARVADAAAIAALGDSSVVALRRVSRGGWQMDVAAERTGSLIRLIATAVRRGPDGALIARRRTTLLLARFPADTVRVLRQGARF